MLQLAKISSRWTIVRFAKAQKPWGNFLMKNCHEISLAITLISCSFQRHQLKSPAIFFPLLHTFGSGNCTQDKFLDWDGYWEKYPSLNCTKEKKTNLQDINQWHLPLNHVSRWLVYTCEMFSRLEKVEKVVFLVKWWDMSN